MVGDATKAGTATTAQKKKITKRKPETNKKTKHIPAKEAVTAAAASILEAKLELRMFLPSSAAFPQKEEG